MSTSESQPGTTVPHKPSITSFLARNLSIMFHVPYTSHLQSTKYKSKQSFILNLHLLFTVMISKVYNFFYLKTLNQI